MNTLTAITTRTSYRGKYKPDKVPREDLEKILTAGLDAPSGCNRQTTSFIAVDDKEVLDKLHAVIDPPVGETAPAMICVLTQKIYAYRDKCYHVQDYSAAIENMLLAIVELGYKSCWIEGHITDTDRIGRKMADILHVPEEYELVCFLPVGKAAESVKKVLKKPYGERAWFNDFQGNSIECEKNHN
ncbi:nitroreductase family protein [[Clostridium] polysaccharolyticum]|uniref:Nitroreductase n=1 Tax=[Clostridium] polysaccharolyticum TaxID=29364 RepID=A0A1H9ZNJ5_9FIRM|nr:nitroreductase family protein [[Clostridium] polysaccharolyticum]SES83298.1 Nitroreductase [[Clostridium] polysaccharolyticum]